MTSGQEMQGAFQPPLSGTGRRRAWKPQVALPRCCYGMSPAPSGLAMSEQQTVSDFLVRRLTE
jgi:hypothetical protein